jgi:hypothetical protein
MCLELLTVVRCHIVDVVATWRPVEQAVMSRHSATTTLLLATPLPCCTSAEYWPTGFAEVQAQT